MLVKDEMTIEEILDSAWSGAIPTARKIYEANMEDEFQQLLEDVFPDVPDRTAINDFMWFDSDYIFEQLGI